MNSCLTRAAPLVGAIAAVLGTYTAHGAGTIQIDETRSVTIGGGLRTGYTITEDGAPSGDDSSSFNVQSLRLYVSGQASEKIKFTFNTECEGCVFGQDTPIGAGGDLIVLDAIAQIELQPEINLWIGRMLTPADRIEMNGPYYGLNWNQYTVPLLPSDQTGQGGLLGRDDGMTVWGRIGKFQYAVGAFNGIDEPNGPNVDDNLLYATRLAYNFLDIEQNPAYYTSSTYFGEGGHILTLGLSMQSQADAVGTAAAPSDFKATILDLLYERPLSRGAALTFEAEYKSLDANVSALAAADPLCHCYMFDGKSYFTTAAYLLPGRGAVRYQPYVRFTKNEPDGGSDSDLFELGVNFVIRGQNAKLNLNYTSGDANLSGYPGADTKTMFFGAQIQI